MQVPFAAAPSAAAQVSQAPAHAALQQKPSTQKPERHWFAPPHAAPCALLGTHAPPLHQLPAPHWALVVHTTHCPFTQPLAHGMVADPYVHGRPLMHWPGSYWTSVFASEQ